MDILTLLDHKNVVNCFGHFSVPGIHRGDLGVILMELCQGSLQELINRKRLRDYEVSRIMKQVLHGVAHMHDNGIIHR